MLSISGTDTTAAQTQLDSFIEKWKTEHVNALILVGRGGVVEAVRREGQGARSPTCSSSPTRPSVESGGQDDVKAHIVPNPYDGIITAEGRIGLEHSKTPHYTYCNDDLREADRHHDPAAERRREAPERPAEQHLRQRRGRVLVRDDVPGHRRRGSART